jgi:hypothetical protein
VNRTIDGRLNDVEDPNTCRDSVGARSTARKAAHRDREASLDRCAVRIRAGDESEEVRLHPRKITSSSYTVSSSNTAKGPGAPGALQKAPNHVEAFGPDGLKQLKLAPLVKHAPS